MNDSSDAEFSDRKVEESPFNSCDRASQLKGLIELEFHDSILRVLIEKSVRLSP